MFCRGFGGSFQVFLLSVFLSNPVPRVSLFVALFLPFGFYVFFEDTRDVPVLFSYSFCLVYTPKQVDHKGTSSWLLRTWLCNLCGKLCRQYNKPSLTLHIYPKEIHTVYNKLFCSTNPKRTCKQGINRSFLSNTWHKTSSIPQQQKINPVKSKKSKVVIYGQRP